MENPIRYKGSGPKPRHKHGEYIYGYGVIHHRTLTSTGTWVYGCYQKGNSNVFYYYDLS